MKNITISHELAQKLINYLASQPYIQVHQLLAELGQAINKETNPPKGSGKPDIEEKK